MSKTKLSRREREKIRHKDEILGAALKLFSKNGFHNVSMQEIAEGSEFGVGTLYKFFESKEALFKELMNRTGQHVVGEFTEILDGPGNEKDRLAGFIRHQPKLQEKHGDVIKLFVSEFGIKGSKLSKIHGESNVHKVLDSKIERLIEQGINKGMFRTVDPAITAKALGSVIETLIFESTGNFELDRVTEMFKKVEQLFLDGLLISGEKNE